MRDFVAIDFETGNPKRVSACALGFTIVRDGILVESDAVLMKPVGGHAEFQTKIHGLREDDTADKPDFGTLYPSMARLFDLPVVGHSLFDKQVLNALADHFGLQIPFEYTDSTSLAKQKLPDLKNHKLKTLVKHFQLGGLKHHDACDDAKACAEIFVRLNDMNLTLAERPSPEFEALALEVLADGQVDYKEACQLMYWIEDHLADSPDLRPLFMLIAQTLEDDVLDAIEGEAIRATLTLALHNRRK